jgi:hypothetical protein
MPSVHVPFPCVVYTRHGSSGMYRFSHHCVQQVLKYFPASLRTSDLRTHNPRMNLSLLHKTCFLLLVGDDTAQGVSISSADCKSRTSFLYHGSSYARKTCSGPQDTFISDFSENYVSLHFHSTMAVFDKMGKFHSVVPIESGVALFPRQMHEKDISKLSKWIESCALKSAHSSVWMTFNGDSYNEFSLECSPRVKERV